MNDKRKILMLLLMILLIIGVTVGITYAFLSYTKEGSKFSSITAGSVTFHYGENTNKTINLNGTMPMDDSRGKTQNAYFEFIITSTNSSKNVIPYMITARKQGTASDRISDNNIKLYLTEVTEENNVEEEEQIVYQTYSDLLTVTKNNNDEQILWSDKVDANNASYEKKYRLRMWIDSNTDFSPLKDNNGNYIIENGDYVYPNNEKEFSVKINVYANENITDVNYVNPTITIGNTSVTEAEGQAYDYQISLPEGTEEAVIDIDTKSEYDQVKIERLDSLDGTAYIENNGNVERMAMKKTLSLEPGDNYYKITVIPVDGDVEEYIIYIYVVDPGVPGFYAEDGTIISWDTLVNTYGLNATNVSNGGTVLNTINKRGKLVLADTVTSIASKAFFDNDKLTEIVFPSSVSQVGYQAFYYNSNLVKVDLGTGISILGESAFQTCQALTSIVIPDSVTKISTNAFQNCTGLTSAIIGRGVTIIERCAFKNNKSLASVVFLEQETWYKGSNNTPEDVSNPAANANILNHEWTCYSYTKK